MLSVGILKYNGKCFNDPKSGVLGSYDTGF